jgi:hypothetical protein
MAEKIYKAKLRERQVLAESPGFRQRYPTATRQQPQPGSLRQEKIVDDVQAAIPSSLKRERIPARKLS